MGGGGMQGRQIRQSSGGGAKVTKIHADTWVNFEKGPLLAFLRKALKKGTFLRIFTLKMVYFIEFLR